MDWGRKWFVDSNVEENEFVHLTTQISVGLLPERILEPELVL